MSQEVEKTRYSDDELQEFKVLLEQKLAKAQQQLDFYLQRISTVESERLTTMAARQRKHIQHLKNALIRIENKVFGICRVSGKLISKQRLKAVPHATLSIHAKQNKGK